MDVTKLRTAIPGAVQAVGGLGAAAGLYLLTGLAWALLGAGLALLVAGTLAEVKGGQ